MTGEIRKKVLDILLQSGIIGAKFTGKVVIAIQDGGIRFIEKTETLK